MQARCLGGSDEVLRAGLSPGAARSTVHEEAIWPGRSRKRTEPVAEEKDCPDETQAASLDHIDAHGILLGNVFGFHLTLRLLFLASNLQS